jgi:hypothetical protein
MVTLGSLLSALGRSFEATVVALFPSIFIPIMVGTWLAQGKAVPFGAVGPLTIGSLCTPFYRSTFACAFARGFPLRFCIHIDLISQACSAINFLLSDVIDTGSLALDMTLCVRLQRVFNDFPLHVIQCV